MIFLKKYIDIFLGNGPSAITLSYILAGNTPFYSGNTNDEFLHLRLTENADEPLVLQDLAFLSDVSFLALFFFEDFIFQK